MKVFISWSGDSKGVAQAIHNSFKELFDQADPWISTENPSGAMWLSKIDESLSDTDFGMICVTKSNQHAQWLNFEAGALSRKVDAKKELMPVLVIDFDDFSDVDGPIAGFQMKHANLEDFTTIMKDLNKSQLGPNIDETVLTKRVVNVWPKIFAEVEKVRSSDVSKNIQKRSVDEKIDEVLDVVRGISGRNAAINWSTGKDEPILDAAEMRQIGKALGEASMKNNLGEMNTTFPENRRALVSVEHPVTHSVDVDMHNAVKDVTWNAIEISYRPMSSQEISSQIALNAEFERFTNSKSD